MEYFRYIFGARKNSASHKVLLARRRNNHARGDDQLEKEGVDKIYHPTHGMQLGLIGADRGPYYRAEKDRFECLRRK